MQAYITEGHTTVTADSRCTLCCGLWSLLRSLQDWTTAGPCALLAANRPTSHTVVHLSCCSICAAACHRLRCARCYCTTGFLVCRSSFTHCSRPKCSNCSWTSHPLISITCCSQAKFDTCQEPTSRLHASQWKWRCRQLGSLMSRDVETTDRPSTNTCSL